MSNLKGRAERRQRAQHRLEHGPENPAVPGLKTMVKSGKLHATSALAELAKKAKKLGGTKEIPPALQSRTGLWLKRVAHKQNPFITGTVK